MAKVIEFYVPTNFRTPLKGKSGRSAKVIENLHAGKEIRVAE